LTEGRLRENSKVYFVGGVGKGGECPAYQKKRGKRTIGPWNFRIEGRDGR